MIYWLIFFSIIILKIKFNKSSEFILWISFYFFLVDIGISLLGLKSISEIILQICVIFLFVGFIFSVKEYLSKNG